MFLIPTTAEDWGWTHKYCVRNVFQQEKLNLKSKQKRCEYSMIETSLYISYFSLVYKLLISSQLETKYVKMTFISCFGDRRNTKLTFNKICLFKIKIIFTEYQWNCFQSGLCFLSSVPETKEKNYILLAYFTWRIHISIKLSILKAV